MRLVRGEAGCFTQTGPGVGREGAAKFTQACDLKVLRRPAGFTPEPPQTDVTLCHLFPRLSVQRHAINPLVQCVLSLPLAMVPKPWRGLAPPGVAGRGRGPGPTPGSRPELGPEAA